ncbi:hypothetical protein CEXT_72411 [Caerostris extrusa]|uniref:Uncharacterized protein n=1 Tax=Caerostris extrusa TaxID=172846 RepID=A0AAV4M4A6_CAEEX|nr:hypothetical protein CEXT_72411 [Caerostris extrusa]
MRQWLPPPEPSSSRSPHPYLSLCKMLFGFWGGRRKSRARFFLGSFVRTIQFEIHHRELNLERSFKTLHLIRICYFYDFC